MNIIKLNAIDSTNLYLKNLAAKKDLDNYTVAVAKHQTAGRGQMGTNWVSEKNKNLTFSMLVRFRKLSIQHQFYCSMAVALAVVKVLNMHVKNSLKIKWPNDILAEKDKVAGILIENVLKGSQIKQSIIGIGLNVNQELFPDDIGSVSSLRLLSGSFIKMDDLLVKLIQSITSFMEMVENKEYNELRKLYFSNLYMFNKPTMFEDDLGSQFMGKIVDVTEGGQLVVELENETTRKFNLKEIKFASR